MLSCSFKCLYTPKGVLVRGSLPKETRVPAAANPPAIEPPGILALSKEIGRGQSHLWSTLGGRDGASSKMES